MLEPGMSYYGEDEEDNGAGASSTGAGVGAGAGSYSSPYGAVDEIDIDNGWLTDMFSSSDASLICVLMSLLLLILVLCAFVLQFFVSVFSLSRGDAVALVAVVVLVGIMCYMGAGGVDGDDDMGYLGSYSSSWSAPTSHKGKPDEPGATGLCNLGNTCYMNSTLQCLSHVPGLTRLFLSGEFETMLNADNPLGTQGAVATQYAALLHELWDDQFRVVAPSKFKATLAASASQFKGNEQHDSQELLGVLLDRLHEDLNQGVRAQGSRGVPPNNQREAGADRALEASLASGTITNPAVQAGAKAWMSHLERNASCVSSMFQGQLSNRLQCAQCQHVVYSFDTFMCLPLPLPPEFRNVKVELVWSHPQRGKFECRSYSFRLPKAGHISSLEDAVRRALDLDATFGIQIAVVYNGRCNKVSGRSSLQQMSRSDLYAFILPPGTLATVAIMNRTLQRQQSFQWATNEDGEDFLRRLQWQMYTLQLWRGLLHVHKKGCDLVPSATKMLVPPATEQGRPTLLFGGVCIDWGTTVDDRDGAHTPSLPSDIDLFPPLQEGKVEEYKSEEAQFDGAMETDGVDLAQCLDKFNTVEVLGENNRWQCPRCKEAVTAKKSMALWRVPDVVVIVLKRFYFHNQSHNKIETLVRFPLRGLDLTRWVSGPHSNAGLVYDLFAVSNHSGSLGAGHYTACAVSAESGVWRSYNDRFVSVVGGSAEAQTPEVLRAALHTKNAYVLMYQRRGVKGAPPIPAAPLARSVSHNSTDEAAGAAESKGSEGATGRAGGGGGANTTADGGNEEVPNATVRDDDAGVGSGAGAGADNDSDGASEDEPPQDRDTTTPPPPPSPVLEGAVGLRRRAARDAHAS